MMTTIAPDLIRMATAYEDVHMAALRAAWQPGRQRPKPKRDLVAWQRKVDKRLRLAAAPAEMWRWGELADAYGMMSRDGDKAEAMQHTLPDRTRADMDYMCRLCMRNALAILHEHKKTWIPRERALVIVETAA